MLACQHTIFYQQEDSNPQDQFNYTCIFIISLYADTSLFLT